MSQLSAQSIRKLSSPHVSWDTKPMIHPFLEEKTVINGMSAGLSAASYDLRIGHDLTLGPNPAASQFVPLDTRSLSVGVPYWALAHTLEDLCIPHNVAAYVIDKSTYARRFLSAFNTYIDPGFTGNLPLELVDFGPEEIYIKAGDPDLSAYFPLAGSNHG